MLLASIIHTEPLNRPPGTRRSLQTTYFKHKSHKNTSDTKMISLVSYLDKAIIEQFQINVYAEAKISNPNDIDETKYYLQSSVHLSLLPKPQPTRTMRVNPVSGGLLFWGSCCQQDDLIPLGRARRTMRAMFHARDAELHQLLAEETVKSRAKPS